MSTPGRRHAESLELGTELAEVVDLAVEDHYITAAGGRHGLRAFIAQVDDREAPMRQADAGSHIEPLARSIGTPMGDGLAHFPQYGDRFVQSAVDIDESRYTAHVKNSSR
jgi:hypothetical protein